VLHHQEAQEHFGRSGVPPLHRRQAVAPHQVATHLRIELVVVEEAVELHEDRVRLGGQFRHAGKDIFGFVALDEHATTSTTA
jgi:hypothetical protein